jgi:hypothetical protein
LIDKLRQYRMLLSSVDGWNDGDLARAGTPGGASAAETSTHGATARGRRMQEEMQVGPAMGAALRPGAGWLGPALRRPVRHPQNTLFSSMRGPLSGTARCGALAWNQLPQGSAWICYLFNECTCNSKKLKEI